MSLTSPWTSRCESSGNLSDEPRRKRTRFSSDMEDMEREKFDKKLQMFYLSQKNGSARAALSNECNDTLASLIKEHCADTLALREANDFARRRISDLESELSELKAKKDAETSVFKTVRSSNSVVIHSSKLSSSGSQHTTDMHIEENRRRERHAALAIAEHDSLIIQQLEVEAEALRSQHECDLTLVKDATGTITRLLEDMKEKDAKISRQTERASLLEKHMKLLAEHIRSAQSLIQNSMQDHRIVLDYALSPDRAMVETSEEHMKRQGLRCWTHVNNLNEQRRPQMLASKITKNGHSLSSNTATGDLNGFTLYDDQEDKFGTIENNLRIENAKLFKMLQKERELSKWQEITIKEIQASAEEVTLLEAAEIVRLEEALEICHIERDEWEKRCNLALLNVEYGAQRSVNPTHRAPS
jgi:hypothetical protein